MLRLFVFAMLVCLPASLAAQALDSLLSFGHRIDSSAISFAQQADEKLYERQHRVSVDTNFIRIPEERWTFKSTFNADFNTLGISQLNDGDGASVQLISAVAMSQGMSVSWRNITVGFSINPAWFIKSLKNDDFCGSFSMYGNRIGMAATVRKTTTLAGKVTALPDSLVADVPWGSCQDFSADFDAYYAFNGREFSYPAAFSHSQIQKRSAGSPLVSLSIRNGKTTLERIDQLENEPMTVWTNMLCLGGGYAHNFVTEHNWLIHVSAVGNAAVLKYNRVHTETDKRKLKGTVFDAVGSLQFSVLHMTGRFFYGMNATARGAMYGRLTTGMFNNSRTEIDVLFGLRL